MSQLCEFDARWHSARAARWTALLALAIGGACADGTSPGDKPGVDLMFRVDRNPSSGAALLGAGGGGDEPDVSVTAAGLRIASDTDVIVITRAQLVVRDVKLRRSGATCDDDNSDLLSALGRGDDDKNKNKGDDRDDDDKACPELKLGPFLVDLPVNGDNASTIAVKIPEGTYESVQFRLHAVTENSPEQLAFRQANPDFRGISARLEGTWNGKPFIFISDVNLKLDVPLTEPLLIGESGSDVTVAINLGKWFVRSSGGLYSPSVANTPGFVRSDVQRNIRFAFRAFCDRNHDGVKD